MQRTPEKPMIARVALDLHLDRLLDYKVPTHLQAKARPGCQVKVLIRTKEVLGSIIEIVSSSPFAELKEVQDIIQDSPLFSSNALQLADWIAHYYCAPYSQVLRFMLPPGVRKNEQEKKQWFIKPRLSQEKIKELAYTIRAKSPAQAAALDIMLSHPSGLFLSEFLTKAQSSAQTIEQLVKKEILEKKKAGIDRALLKNATFFPSAPKRLNPDQQSAFDKIAACLETRTFGVHLLFGVTGSGKTEVYLQAIQKALDGHRTALFLVPEIALTSQTLERIQSRFPTQEIVMFHHRLGDGEKRDAWHKVQRGDIKIVIGARSSVFAPLQSLGLIIIDEEHEHSYKQQDQSPCYHARDVSIMRAKIEGATVILGSATPSLESYYQAQQGKYTLSLLHHRAGNASLAKVKIIDRKQDREKGLFSASLLTAIEKRIRTGEQVLLLLNRRGYHSYQICQSCHESVKCAHCSISLTHHRSQEKLSCHLCGYETPPPTTCAHCQSPDHLQFKGCGTEQVERSLKAIFPEARLLRMDADTTQHKGSHEVIIKAFRSGKADILIGTQMIAKGLHFPLVSLVGILYADMGLNIPDFRAAESTFQLITQAAGRAGREDIPGEVLLQTYLPDQLAITTACAQNYPEFARQELANRQSFAFSPYKRLVKLTLSGPAEDRTHTLLQELRERLIKLLPASCEVLAPVPSGYPKIKDRYYFQLLIKTAQPLRLQPLLKQTHFTPPTHYRLLIDVDPLSTY